MVLLREPWYSFGGQADFARVHRADGRTSGNDLIAAIFVADDPLRTEQNSARDVSTIYSPTLADTTETLVCVSGAKTIDGSMVNHRRRRTPGASISVLLNSAHSPTERMLQRFLYGFGLDVEEARPWLERRRALARGMLTTDGDPDCDALEADGEDNPAAPGSPAIAEEAGASRSAQEGSTCEPPGENRRVHGDRIGSRASRWRPGRNPTSGGHSLVRARFPGIACGFLFRL